jgi:hypothetical protein
MVYLPLKAFPSVDGLAAGSVIQGCWTVNTLIWGNSLISLYILGLLGSSRAL